MRESVALWLRLVRVGEKFMLEQARVFDLSEMNAEHDGCLQNADSHHFFHPRNCPCTEAGEPHQSIPPPCSIAWLQQFVEADGLEEQCKKWEKGYVDCDEIHVIGRLINAPINDHDLNELSSHDYFFVNRIGYVISGNASEGPVRFEKGEVLQNGN